jgi:hypothetical protein
MSNEPRELRLAQTSFRDSDHQRVSLEGLCSAATRNKAPL